MQSYDMGIVVMCALEETDMRSWMRCSVRFTDCFCFHKGDAWAKVDEYGDMTFMWDYK